MPEILIGEQRASARASADPDRLARHAARVFAAGGAILLLGVLVDLVTLWVLQRQETVQWEFIALGTTTNSYPLLLISVVLFYGALALGRTNSVAAYRIAAVLVVLIGVFGLAVGFLLGTNYLAFRRVGTPDPETAAVVFKSMAVKGGALSLIFGGIMAAVGVLGLRLPKKS